MDEAAGEFGSREEALETYREVFQDAVRSHLVSDVPIGLFLSGGMDSSSLLAGIVEGGHDDIRCFTADFGLGGNIDESGFARTVADHFGVQHDVLTVGSASVDVLEEIVWHLDEPIGDPAVIPTYLIAQAAAKEVKVVITGEGSDEVNAGYQRELRYQLFQENQRKIRAIDGLPAWLKRLPPIARKLAPWAAMLRSGSEAECFRRLDGFEFGEGLFADGVVPFELGMASLESIAASCRSHDPLERRLQFCRSSFMLEDLIPKVDRMTMAHGLEARVPFLDHHLVETTSRIPGRWRVDTRGRRTKAILRDCMLGRLPESTLARGQHGFNVPLKQWFTDGLTQYMVSILRDRRTASRGVLRAGDLATLADSIEHRGDPAKSALMVVMMEIWFRRYID
jgi:asparagine synthase (glutamine-hydrolysing)